MHQLPSDSAIAAWSQRRLSGLNSTDGFAESACHRLDPRFIRAAPPASSPVLQISRSSHASYIWADEPLQEQARTLLKQATRRTYNSLGRPRCGMTYLVATECSADLESPKIDLARSTPRMSDDLNKASNLIQ
jgi:hypothetical protein